MLRYSELRRIRFWLAVFVAGLILSGLTAFPLETEIRWLDVFLHGEAIRPTAAFVHLLGWIDRVDQGLIETNARFPFLAYGTDWLGFVHLVIAVAFLGPYLDPVRNKWVVNFGLIACAGVIPFALIGGPVRGIPLSWRLIDCGFGIVGSIPLFLARHAIKTLGAESEPMKA